MAPRSLSYTRVGPKRVVKARELGVTHSDVAQGTTAGCFSAKPAAVTHDRIPLSGLDTLLFIRPLQACVAFFYAGSIDENALIYSLSATLARFPLLTGRIRPASKRAGEATDETAVNAQYEVLLNDEGVPFDTFACSGSIADFNAFQDWSIAGMHTQPLDNTTPPAFLPKLDTAGILAGAAPLARFRLTRLADGGCILGVNFAHLVIDGISGAMFCSAWSLTHEALARGVETPPKLPMGEPIFDRRVFVKAATTMPEDVPEEAIANARTVHERVTSLMAAVTPGKLLKRCLKIGSDVLLRKNANFTIRISGPQMARARAAGAAATGTPLSSNDVAIGIAWTLLRRMRARGPGGAPRLVAPSDGAGAEHFMLQTVDLRRYLPGLPPNYFGNCAWAIRVAAPVAADTPSQFAAGSRASLALFANSTTVFEQASMMLQAGAQPGVEQLKAMFLPAFADGMISSWHLPMMWDFTWGCGKPVWFAGGIFPVAPWGFCVLAGRPDAVAAGTPPDFLLQGSCPAKKLRAVVEEAQRLVVELCGADPPATAQQQPTAQEAAPESVVAMTAAAPESVTAHSSDE